MAVQFSRLTEFPGLFLRVDKLSSDSYKGHNDFFCFSGKVLKIIHAKI